MEIDTRQVVDFIVDLGASNQCYNEIKELAEKGITVSYDKELGYVMSLSNSNFLVPLSKGNFDDAVRMTYNYLNNEVLQDLLECHAHSVSLRYQSPFAMHLPFPEVGDRVVFHKDCFCEHGKFQIKKGQSGKISKVEIDPDFCADKMTPENVFILIELDAGNQRTNPNKLVYWRFRPINEEDELIEGFLMNVLQQFWYHCHLE